MKTIKLSARLSAYSKVEAVDCTAELKEMTTCAVDELFGEECNDLCTTVTTAANEMSCSDIDALFKDLR